MFLNGTFLLLFISNVVFLLASDVDDQNNLLTCRDGWVTHSHFCYKFEEFMHTWQQASDQCASQRASLLTLESDEERQWVASQVVRHDSVQSWWLGLKGLEPDFQWNQTTLPTNYTTPFTEEPDNANGTDNCAMVSSRGFFRDENCSRVERFICKLQKPTPESGCQTDIQFALVRNTTTHCYWFFFMGRRNWDDAKTLCRSIKLTNADSTKADLLSLSDANERDQVIQLLMAFAGLGDAWWTGLRYQEQNQAYVFSDGTPYGSSDGIPWLSKARLNVSSNECGTMLTNGKVTGYTCDYYLSSICKHPRTRRPTHQLACPDALWFDSGHSCYYPDQEKRLTWSEARAACSTKGGHLLKTDSMVEQRWLQKTVALDLFQRYWTGLNAQSRPAGDYVWEDGSRLNDSLIQWDKGHLAWKHCSVLKMASGMLDYAQCDTYNQKLACEYQKEKRENVSCLPGWRSYGDKCYYFSVAFEYGHHWNEMQIACNKLISNVSESDAPMAVNYITIENTGQLNFVLNATRSLKFSDIWLGLNDRVEEDKWVWEGSPSVSADTVPVSPSAREPNPALKCVAIFKGGFYTTSNCSTENYFMCEKERNTLSRASPTGAPWPLFLLTSCLFAFRFFAI